MEEGCPKGEYWVIVKAGIEVIGNRRERKEESGRRWNLWYHCNDCQTYTQYYVCLLSCCNVTWLIRCRRHSNSCYFYLPPIWWRVSFWTRSILPLLLLVLYLDLPVSQGRRSCSMDGLPLSVERPVLISTSAREKLESARKRLRLEQDTGQNGNDSDEDRIEILERAHEDENSSARWARCFKVCRQNLSDCFARIKARLSASVSASEKAVGRTRWLLSL